MSDQVEARLLERRPPDQEAEAGVKIGAGAGGVEASEEVRELVKAARCSFRTIEYPCRHCPFVADRYAVLQVSLELNRIHGNGSLPGPYQAGSREACQV